MNFSQAFKVFQLNILRQAGVAVTPQQLGLKSDPIADLQAKNAADGTFGSVLSKLGATSLQNLAAPTPPTPPADPTDTAAQTKYQQDFLAYTQNMQAYNQRFMQMMMQQMQALQQAIAANRQQTSEKSSSDTGTIGVGGILGGMSDV